MYKYIFLLLFIPIYTFSQKSLSPDEFATALREHPDAHLIDLRNINQYMTGHIKSARLIDYFRDDFKSFFQKSYPKDAQIFLYAQTKESTENAGLYIYELGYEKLTVLEGGFENWIRKSKPYKSTRESVNPLHFMSRENYVRLIKDKDLILVTFHEEYCEPCEKIDEIVSELKQEVSGLHSIKINSEINSSLSEWLKIYKNPTLILYKDGIQYWRTTTVPTIEKLKEHIY